MVTAPSIIEFGKGFAAHWKGSMSGGAGIIAAAGALGFGWTNAQTFFWGAVVAFAIGSYGVWADERKRVVALDASALREAVRLRIAELVTEGAGMRNEATDAYHPFSPDGWVGWEMRLQAWHNVVLSELKKVSPADAEWYRTLNVVPPPEIPIGLSAYDETGGRYDEICQAYAMHNFRLKKLEQLVSGDKGNILVRA